MSKKVKKIRRSKVVKTRNSNTMSESAFFGWLRSRMRRLTIYWKPIQEVKKAAKVPYKGPNKRRKFSYVCNNCHTPVSDKECNVHHVYPAGSLKSFADLSGFCERLFVEKDKLVLLCHKCHDLEHEKIEMTKKEDNYSKAIDFIANTEDREVKLMVNSTKKIKNERKSKK